jgi:hypothetical protein
VELAAGLVAHPQAVEPLRRRVGGDLGGLVRGEADRGELADVAAVADQFDVEADLEARHREHAQVAGVAEVEGEALRTRLAVGAELDARLDAEVGGEDLLRARYAGPEVDVVLRPAQTQRRSPPPAPAR